LHVSNDWLAVVARIGLVAKGVSFALVGVLALFREEITSAWPPAARLYLALGLGSRT